MPIVRRHYEYGMFQLGSAFRRTLVEKHDRFPWYNWIKLVYNDALTYNPATGAGGVKASWRFREFSRLPQNKPLYALALELESLKAKQEF